MDSITQAALGALCGELVLGKKIGNKGLLWGALFGTMPDLDVIIFPFLSASEELDWHRGISHSIVMMFAAAAFFGWLMHKFYLKKSIPISFSRAAWFVFLAWSTHVLIDCFNTYGTMILEPFSSARISINNLFIIDLFFLVPMLIGLILIMAFGRMNSARRMKIATITACWLCFYFMISLGMKYMANQHFEQVLAENGLSKKRMMTAPTFSNIFLWRMIAEDQSGETFYTSYWSIFDRKDEPATLMSIKKDHQLEVSFQDSKDLKTITNFTEGWHKTYQSAQEPNTIYIAALNMGEMQIAREDGIEIRPAFIWKISRNADGSYTLGRAFKMSQDGSRYMKNAISKTVSRVLGNTEGWHKEDSKWTWDM